MFYDEALAPSRANERERERKRESGKEPERDRVKGVGQRDRDSLIRETYARQIRERDIGTERQRVSIEANT